MNLSAANGLSAPRALPLDESQVALSVGGTAGAPKFALDERGNVFLREMVADDGPGASCRANVALEGGDPSSRLPFPGAVATAVGGEWSPGIAATSLIDQAIAFALAEFSSKLLQAFSRLPPSLHLPFLSVVNSYLAATGRNDAGDLLLQLVTRFLPPSDHPLWSDVRCQTEVHAAAAETAQLLSEKVVSGLLDAWRVAIRSYPLTVINAATSTASASAPASAPAPKRRRIEQATPARNIDTSAPGGGLFSASIMTHMASGQPSLLRSVGPPPAAPSGGLGDL